MMPKNGPYAIAPYAFTISLVNAVEAGKAEIRNLGQRRFTREIISIMKKETLLYIPFHIPGHWVIVQMDKRARRVSYSEDKTLAKFVISDIISTGNSLEPENPKDRKDVHGLVKRVFFPLAEVYWNITPHWGGNILHQVQQPDSYSCGPIVINFLERLVSSDTPQWNVQNAVDYRIKLFDVMAEYAIKNMVCLQLILKM